MRHSISSSKREGEELEEESASSSGRVRREASPNTRFPPGSWRCTSGAY